MEAIDKATVKHVALLSRLALSDEELSLYAGQLAAILLYISKLSQLDTAGVQPTSHVLASLQNVYRKDIPKPSLDSEKVLSNAPARDGGFFKVPQVIEGK